MSHGRRKLKLCGPSVGGERLTSSDAPRRGLPRSTCSQVSAPEAATPRHAHRHAPAPRPPTQAPLLSRRTAARARIKMASCPASVTSGSAFTKALTLARGSLERRAPPGALVGAWACGAVASPPGASSSLGVPLPAAAGTAAIPARNVLRAHAAPAPFPRWLAATPLCVGVAPPLQGGARRKRPFWLWSLVLPSGRLQPESGRAWPSWAGSPDASLAPLPEFARRANLWGDPLASPKRGPASGNTF